MNHYPIFTQLHQRKVLLVGGGQVAERKASALLQAGAQLKVVAQQTTSRFQDWFAAQQAEHIATEFSPALLSGVFLVVAATNDPALNRQIFLAAEAAATFCNCVDQPACCSFIVPALIDRSPIQVAISSGGHAPVLARLIRQQIETLLPFSIGKAAALAGRWRTQVKQTLQHLSERRRFWEQLFQHSRFSQYVASGDEKAAESLLQQQLNAHQPLTQGEVVLVGAGPGDAGLLTLHALQALQAADVVLYDALVSAEVLELVRRDALRISVGKRCGNHQVQQQQTNELLVKWAQQGKRVARLKGGDPFVFGRGGEECAVLQAAGIPFRVIPGISAGLGATAYAGIPLTHRDYAQSVLFITGHQQLAAQSHGWHTLAGAQQTLVIYMGTLTAAEISRQLIAHGRAATTPVAIISQGTLPQQTVSTGQLHQLASLAQQAATPALIVIGEVVSLRQQLAWFQPSSAHESVAAA
ncbi:siroheme synthase CysG [Snodgrassella alvi]|uniref:siroheme synthase CysG n=1 Tax=Snodgrassella alvi TaxID=1196083 RepID=UPI000C1F76DB|nr:siroheme synthase CysG [Snodgrassella alvi]PIT40314.1 uroporphyrinogen-III C-methyltransferase [Snodgrassella alvi]